MKIYLYWSDEAFLVAVVKHQTFHFINGESLEITSTVPLRLTPAYILVSTINTEVEFKDFESRLKFETRLIHGWFHLKLYLVHHLKLRNPYHPK